MQTILFNLSLIVLLGGCGALQTLSVLKARRWRFLLPALTVLAVLICVGKFAVAQGWDSLAWLFYFIWASTAFLGTLLGALVGVFLRRRSRKNVS